MTTKNAARVTGFLLSMSVLVSVLPQAHAQGTTRDWRTWPFSQTSPWNMPIGSAAHYQPIDLSVVAGYGVTTDAWAPKIVQGVSSNSQVKVLTNVAYPATNWSYLDNGGVQCGASGQAEQTLRASSVSAPGPYLKNPWSTIPVAPVQATSQGWQTTVYMPSTACPSPDSDGLLSVFQPNGWVLDSYATVVLSNRDIVGDQVTSFVDARGDGTGYSNGRRASLLPSFAGSIRTGELTSKIPHALAIVVPTALLKEQAVWPAYAFDMNSGYSGQLPMGALLAIPPSVNIAKLGLSPKGLVVAKAAQDYGVYIVDRGGSGITYQSELNNPDALSWTQAYGDLAVITNRLQWVNNNSAAHPGGGGALRAPLAPAFYDASVCSAK